MERSTCFKSYDKKWPGKNIYTTLINIRASDKKLFTGASWTVWKASAGVSACGSGVEWTKSTANTATGQDGVCGQHH